MQKNNNVKIAWYGKHFGEEPPLVGNEKQGAGGIFFSGCNLKCVFCQNFQISHEGLGKDYSVEELANIMLDLQRQGAVNIDLVSPTIWWKQIKDALVLARESGLTLPVVWNSNSYEAVDVLKKMEGLVDIYLPDFKYANDELAFKYSGVKKYLSVCTKAIKEMLRQVGPDLRITAGVCTRGLIVRHLVLPNNIENSLKVLEIIAGIDRRLHISLMSQYCPLNKAGDFDELNRTLSKDEFIKVYNHLLELGFANGWSQDEESSGALVPDFTKQKPFDI